MYVEFLEFISSQGIWSLLSFILIFYILRAQEKRDEKQEVREKNYQKFLTSFDKHLDQMHVDIKELKKKMNRNR